MRFHGLYRCLCKDFYIEGRLACLATDINAILYLYLTFLLTLEQVSVTFRQLPNLPVFCGGGGLSKIRACPYFGKCGNLRTVPYDAKILPAASHLDAGRRVKDRGRSVDTYINTKNYWK